MKAGEEYRLKIQAYTPDTIPMARLAEYLAQLAEVLGEAPSVHFVRLEEGSTVLVHKIEAEAVPKVRRRVQAIRRKQAPRDAQRAYEKINRYLREDNGSAVLKEETTGAEIITFPGREAVEEQFGGVKQPGAVDGEVIRVGGARNWVPVLLESEGQQIAGCWAIRTVAKQLALRLFEPVRLFGMGTWERDEAGKWLLTRFVIERFTTLKEETLSEALARINAVAGDWGGVTIEDIDQARNGPLERRNGSF